MPGRTLGIIGIEDRFDTLLALFAALASEIDAFRSLLRHFEVGDSRHRNALGNQITFVDPAAGGSLNLPEQMQRRRLSGIAEARVHEMFGEVIGNRARPDSIES